MAYINGKKVITNVLYAGSTPTDALNAIVECEHKHEITGDTGNEHGLAISDQQMLLKKIQGQTLVVNQLIDNNLLSGGVTKNGLAFSKNSDNSINIAGTSTSATYQLLDEIKLMPNHHYLLTSSSTNVKLGVFYSGVIEKWDNGTGTIFTYENTNIITANFQTNIPSGKTINETIYPQLIDLTLMFGVGKEPTTVEEFYNKYGKSYIEYNTGELVHSNNNLVSTGRNLWDEKILNNYYLDSSTGLEVASTGAMCAKTYSPIAPNKTYYFRTLYAYESDPYIPIYFYDANKKYISRVYRKNTQTFTTPTNAYYFKISFPINYGTVYNNDICVNVYDSDFNGNYEPYKQEQFEINQELKAFDYINNLSGKLVKATSETVVLNGSEIWAFGRTYTATDATDPTLYRFDLTYDISSLFDKTEYRGSAICNRMTWNHDTEFKEIRDCQITVNTSGTIIYVLLPVAFAEANGITTDDITTFTTWLSNNNLEFVYKLKAPTETDINLPSGLAVYTNGMQIQNGDIPYILTKEYALNSNAQILANIEIDREQQEQINKLKQSGTGSTGGIEYLTTPPTSANTNGLKIVLLDISVYPLTSITSYDGYIYMWH